MIIETFRQALQNVWSNKLRTFLTMLGIIIGVMAVIVIVGLGNGMTQSMRDSFSALGTNALSIQVWGYGSRTASVEDVYKIADKNKELISAVSPQIDFSNNTPKVGTTTYRYGTSVYGVDEHYAEMKNYTLAQGRGYSFIPSPRGAACSTWTSRTTSRSASLVITSTGRPTAATRWARPSSWGPTSSGSWAC